VQASPQQLAPGQNLVLTGSGFPPGSSLTAQLFSDPVLLGTTTADAAGTYRMVVTVPLGTAPGVHTIRVSAAGTTLLAETTVVVLAPVTAAQVGNGTILSRTGADVRGPARVALGLLLTGFVLIGCAGVDRRRPWPAGRR
jgi:hypothetical protein